MTDIERITKYLPSWAYSPTCDDQPSEVWWLEITDAGNPGGRIPLRRYTSVFGCRLLKDNSAAENGDDQGGNGAEIRENTDDGANSGNPAQHDEYSDLHFIDVGAANMGEEVGMYAAIALNPGSCAATSSNGSSAGKRVTKRNKLMFEAIDFESEYRVKINGTELEKGNRKTVNANDRLSFGDSSRVFRLVRGTGAHDMSRALATTAPISGMAGGQDDVTGWTNGASIADIFSEDILDDEETNGKQSMIENLLKEAKEEKEAMEDEEAHKEVESTVATHDANQSHRISWTKNGDDDLLRHESRGRKRSRSISSDRQENNRHAHDYRSSPQRSPQKSRHDRDAEGGRRVLRGSSNDRGIDRRHIKSSDQRVSRSRSHGRRADRNSPKRKRPVSPDNRCRDRGSGFRNGRNNSRSRSGSRSRRADKDRQRDRNRERDRNRDRDKDKDRDRNMNRDEDINRGRKNSPSPSRSRSRSRGDRSCDRKRDRAAAQKVQKQRRSRSGSRDRDRDRDRDWRSPDKKRNSRSRSRSRGRGVGRGRQGRDDDRKKDSSKDAADEARKRHQQMVRERNEEWQRKRDSERGNNDGGDGSKRDRDRRDGRGSPQRRGSDRSDRDRDRDQDDRKSGDRRNSNRTREADRSKYRKKKEKRRKAKASKMERMRREAERADDAAGTAKGGAQD